MSSEVENIIDELLDNEPNVGGAAVISNDGKIIYQTENWDLTPEVENVLNTVKSSSSSITLFGIKYMIVENTPERIIGTNIQGKGHIIIAPFNEGVLLTFIVPQVGPRDALFNVQSFAMKLNGKI
ncbi:MAG: profilin family protein [Promethearchaeota archaeon]